MTLELRDLDKPPLRPDDVLIRVRACGVCGSDLHGFLGKSSRRIPPLVLGHEFSGDVEQNAGCSGPRLGSAVAVYPLLCCGQCRFCFSGRENICPNRRVFGLDLHGGLAEFVAAPADCAFPLPAGMSHVEGALVEPLANAIHVVSRIPDVRGLTGLVYGAGPIGIFCFLVARARGAARLAVVDRNRHRLAMAKNLGADLIVDASVEDPVHAVQRWTDDGYGVDFSIEAVGGTACRQNAIACTASGGTVACIGLDEEVCKVDTRPAVVREMDIRGAYAYTRKDFGVAIAMLASHDFHWEPLVTTAGMDAGQRIFEELAEGRSAIIKAVFLA
jgi:L-iditol 2-dehydrogenase